MNIRNMVATFAVTVAFSIAALAGVSGVGAHDNDNDGNGDANVHKLFRDGSISCSGADDLSKRGGRVTTLVGEGVVHFIVKLKNASPNTLYTLAVSEEPNCANAQFYPGGETTDSEGKATFYGTYNTTPGSHNLLFNMVTSTPDKAQNREIGTKNAWVNVPAPSP